jgi:NADH dehydrogenase
VGRLHLAGFIAWWIWLFIHIGFLTGYRNRLGAVLSWWLVFTRDLRRERVFTTKEVGYVPDVYSFRLPPSATGAELPSAGTEPSGRPG